VNRPIRYKQSPTSTTKLGLLNRITRNGSVSTQFGYQYGLLSYIIRTCKHPIPVSIPDMEFWITTCVHFQVRNGLKVAKIW